MLEAAKEEAEIKLNKESYEDNFLGNPYLNIRRQMQMIQESDYSSDSKPNTYEVGLNFKDSSNKHQWDSYGYYADEERLLKDQQLEEEVRRDNQQAKKHFELEKDLETDFKKKIGVEQILDSGKEDQKHFSHTKNTTKGGSISTTSIHITNPNSQQNLKTEISELKKKIREMTIEAGGGNEELFRNEYLSTGKKLSPEDEVLNQDFENQAENIRDLNMFFEKKVLTKGSDPQLEEMEIFFQQNMQKKEKLGNMSFKVNNSPYMKLHTLNHLIDINLDSESNSKQSSEKDDVPIKGDDNQWSNQRAFGTGISNAVSMDTNNTLNFLKTNNSANMMKINSRTSSDKRLDPSEDYNGSKISNNHSRFEYTMSRGYSKYQTDSKSYYFSCRLQIK